MSVLASTTPLVFELRDMGCAKGLVEVDRKTRTLPGGTRFSIVFEQPEVYIDIAAWCDIKGYEILGLTVTGKTRVALVEIRR